MQNKTVPSPARPVIWLIIILGILAIIAALIFMVGGGSAPFGFTTSALLALGILFALVGAVLYFLLPSVEAPPTVDMSGIDGAINDVDAKIKLLEERLNTLESKVASSSQPAPAALPQDLLVIEGIGPKVKGALLAARIDTIEKLARASDDSLKAAIKAAGINFAPSLPTWSKQAKLVVSGDLEAFEKYKDDLTAGRETK